MSVSIAKARKFLVAAAGLVAEVLNAGLLHGTAQHVVSVVAAALAAGLVYIVPNAPASTPVGVTGPGNPAAPPATPAG